jgi:XTP/dITP diphosphohydrolase
VRSARYAGEDATDEENLAKLLREAPAGSALEYVCALVYVDLPAGVERVFEAGCTGRLAADPRGAGGFGYDPAFLPDDMDWSPPVPGPPVPEGQSTLTMAELTDEQKDAISHRGRAARALLSWLSEG